MGEEGDEMKRRYHGYEVKSAEELAALLNEKDVQDREEIGWHVWEMSDMIVHGDGRAALWVILSEDIDDGKAQGTYL